MSEQIDFDHFPEVVEDGKGIRRLELMGLNEKLSNAPERRALFANMTDDDFQKMTGYINSVTRGKKISYDYENGQLPMLVTPDLEDKTELMGKTFQAVRDIAADPELDDHAALRRAGLAMTGAINYIHPFKDGNGRTGRVLHYLMEFGTERGDQAFGEELFAVIGKLSVYETDKHKAMYDSPPPELERALNNEVKEAIRHDEIVAMSDRKLAAARVVVFLDMMRGVKDVPINEKVKRGHGSSREGNRTLETIEPGSIDGFSLYVKDYTELSTLPNRLPSDVPEDAHRVIVGKSAEQAETFSLLVDIVS